MRESLSFWFLILMFALGFGISSGYVAYWISGDVLVAQVVCIIFGIVGIKIANKVVEEL